MQSRSKVITMRTALTLALALFAAPMAAQADDLTVPVNQSRVLPFIGVVQDVVVGNTEIADIRVIDTRTVVLIGKQPGVTNVMLLDNQGRTLFNDRVIVSANSGSAVTVYRGGETVEMACSPYCQATDAAAPAS